MNPRAKFLLGVAVGYFIMPKLVLIFWDVAGSVRNK